MSSPFLSYNGLRFLNVPHARDVFEEVVVNDCYGIANVPADAVVIDVGAMYGEFAIACAKLRGSTVYAYEPNQESYDVLQANCVLNNVEVDCKPWAVGDETKMVRFEPMSNHPGGSHVSEGGSKLVHQRSIDEVLANVPLGRREVVVKLDCEGSEQAIFNKSRWLARVERIVMEFHAHDGDHYERILRKLGWTSIKLTGTGDGTALPWDKSMTAGILIAKR